MRIVALLCIMTAPSTMGLASVAVGAATPSPSPHDNSPVQFMLDHLSREELELAARTSYEYANVVPNLGHATNSCSRHQREYYASVMAKRYLNSKSDKGRALEFMKATLRFRKQVDIDRLVNCTTATPRSEDQYNGLRRFLSTKQSFVQGFDKFGRATYIFVPRLVREHDAEWTLKGHVWSLERAIACSKAPDKTVNFVVDFSGFDVRTHAPPMAIGKEIMLTLRNHYVGHVNSILLVNAPTTFVCLWALFKRFAGSKTRDKIHFVNSVEEQQSIIGRLYEPEEATEWMLPLGQRNRELDLDEYLDRTPFDQAFDERKAKTVDFIACNA